MSRRLILAGLNSTAAVWMRIAAPVGGTAAVGMKTHGPWSGRNYGGASVVADRAGNVLAVLRDRNAEVRLSEVPLPNCDQSRPRS